MQHQVAELLREAGSGGIKVRLLGETFQRRFGTNLRAEDYGFQNFGHLLEEGLALSTEVAFSSSSEDDEERVVTWVCGSVGEKEEREARQYWGALAVLLVSDFGQKEEQRSG